MMPGSGNYLQDRLEREMERHDAVADEDEIYERRKDEEIEAKEAGLGRKD